MLVGTRGLAALLNLVERKQPAAWVGSVLPQDRMWPGTPLGLGSGMILRAAWTCASPPTLAHSWSWAGPLSEDASSTRTPPLEQGYPRHPFEAG